MIIHREEYLIRKLQGEVFEEDWGLVAGVYAFLIFVLPIFILFYYVWSISQPKTIFNYHVVSYCFLYTVCVIIVLHLRNFYLKHKGFLRFKDYTASTGPQ